jgi:hypothetical protein
MTQPKAQGKRKLHILEFPLGRDAYTFLLGYAVSDTANEVNQAKCALHHVD